VKAWGTRAARWALALVGLAGIAVSAHADEALWRALAGGGYVVMIRHAATEPGVGDPAAFKLGDCATQRNLSAAGRADARRLGEEFRRRRIPVTRVLSSEWCRCRDTAQLAFGAYDAWPEINSFFRERAGEPARTQAVRALAGTLMPGENIVLVTHQVNISAVAGVGTATGEMVLLKPTGPATLELAGRLKAD
jgi:broad specificity phosphatase PhoE